MQDAHSAHPTDPTLQAYILGTLDVPLAETVNSHLEICLECRYRVAELSGNRASAGVPGADSPHDPLTDSESVAEPTLTFRGPNTPRGGSPPAAIIPPPLADSPNYQIVRELGRGGMGVVYLAHNRLMGRPEVLKVVSTHLLGRRGVLDRFLREIHSAAHLHHPNIVAAYSAFHSGESIVFAMEYAQGLDLAKMVKSKGPLPVPHACFFAQQAALGLQHAFEQGMVHRDIKPSNLMLARKGERAVIKILDFGLAKASSEDPSDLGLTNEGQMLGTPAFIAPEQIRDARTADIRADIYSLGCTLYYLLSGGAPFRERSLYDILHAHRTRHAAPLNSVRPEVPPALAVLVAKMMAKDPSERFQTPAEVALALTPFFRPAGKGAEVPRPTQTDAAPLHPDSANSDDEILATQLATQVPSALSSPLLTDESSSKPDVVWERLIAVTENEPSEVSTSRPHSTRRTASASWLIWAAGSLVALGALGIALSRSTRSTKLTRSDNPATAVAKVDALHVTGAVKKPTKRIEPPPTKGNDAPAPDTTHVSPPAVANPSRTLVDTLAKPPAETPATTPRDDAPKNPRLMDEDEINRFARALIPTLWQENPEILKGIEKALGLNLMARIADREHVSAFYPLPKHASDAISNGKSDIKKNANGNLVLIEFSKSGKTLTLPVLLAAKSSQGSAVIRQGRFIDPNGEALLNGHGEPVPRNLAALPVTLANEALALQGFTVDENPLHPAPHVKKPLLTVVGGMPRLSIEGEFQGDTTVVILPDGKLAVSFLSERPIAGFNAGTAEKPFVVRKYEQLLCGIPGIASKDDDVFTVFVEGAALEGDLRGHRIEAESSDGFHNPGKQLGVAAVGVGVEGRANTLISRLILTANDPKSAKKPGSLRLYPISRLQPEKNFPAKEVEFGDEQGSFDIPALRLRFAREPLMSRAMREIAQADYRAAFARAWIHLPGLMSLNRKEAGTQTVGSLGPAIIDVRAAIASGNAPDGTPTIRIQGGDSVQIDEAYRSQRDAAEDYDQQRRSNRPAFQKGAGNGGARKSASPDASAPGTGRPRVAPKSRAKVKSR